MLFILDLRKLRVVNPVHEMVKGMKPWLAFFTIWSSYLKANGWKYSVDMEGYNVAEELDKPIVYLETIEEQIKVLENLSKQRIVYFLNQVDQWHELAQIGFAQLMYVVQFTIRKKTGAPDSTENITWLAFDALLIGCDRTIAFFGDFALFYEQDSFIRMLTQVIG